MFIFKVFRSRSFSPYQVFYFNSRVFESRTDLPISVYFLSLEVFYISVLFISRVFKSSSVSVYGKVGDDDSISVPLFNENEEDLQTQLRIEREAKENYYAKLIDMAEKYEEEKKVKEDAVRSLSYAESMWKASEKAKDEALSR